MFASLKSAYGSSRGYVNSALVVVVLSVLSVVGGAFAIAPPLGQIVAGGVIAFVDGALVWMLWLAADLSLKTKKPDSVKVRGSLPRRDAAVIQFPLYLVSLVLSAACLYVTPGTISACGGLNSIYFSVVTIATVGYGDIHPLTDFGKVVAMVEIASGVLLLVCALPILVGRLAALDEAA